ncbi:MAG: GNAT family N-acetyltransferase [Candidatus Rifleibacteriota bacterium]
MKVISVRERPEYVGRAVEYFQKHWANENTMALYDDCITHCVDAAVPLPQWYLLVDENDEIIGCAGLITNDFISRMDLYPWVCAIFIEKEHRGNAYGSILIEKAKEDTVKGGFSDLYLCTDHIGYYEKYGFEYIADGFHPWGEKSRIYKASLC